MICQIACNRFDSHTCYAICKQNALGCLRTCNPGQSLFCIARALLATCAGDTENGLYMCGANVEAVKKIYPLKEFFDTLEGE